MAFESLTERLQGIFRRLKGRGKLSESDVAAAMKEIRMALLEADVNFKVVKGFTERVKARAIGQEVLESLTPAQVVVKIVHEEMTDLLGKDQRRLVFSSTPPSVIMMVGLQGSGKTTTSGKLALHLKKQGKFPALMALDLRRPAAIEQLERLGERVNVPVLKPSGDQAPAAAELAIREAKARGLDTVILDTAGRLHIDTDLMAELEDIEKRAKPSETLLVVDAMTGQDAINVAESFHQRLGITGIVLSKLDGDARGGAALSVLSVTGAPVKFTGVGEKPEALEPFHPDRMASRILGMGDVLTLVEKAEATMDQKRAKEMERKLRQNALTLEDFLEQLKEIRKMGPLDEILGMLPGAASKQMKGLKVDEREINRVEAIINSMTKKERFDPSIIDSSRRKRIARGSGAQVQDVNRLLKQFQEMQKMFKRFQGSQKGFAKGKLPF